MQSPENHSPVRPGTGVSRRDFVRAAVAGTTGVVVLSGASLVQCGVTIRQFDVFPKYLCMGEDINVFWTVDPAMSVRIRQSDDGPVLEEYASAEEGSKTFPVNEDVDVELVHNGNVLRTTGVIVVRKGEARPITFTAIPTCIANAPGPDIPRWAIVNSPQDFSPNLRVCEVQNESGSLSITVEHDGLSVGLPPTEDTAAFEDHNPAGDWQLGTVQDSSELDRWCARGAAGQIAQPPALTIDLVLCCLG